MVAAFVASGPFVWGIAARRGCTDRYVAVASPDGAGGAYGRRGGGQPAGADDSDPENAEDGPVSVAAAEPPTPAGTAARPLLLLCGAVRPYGPATALGPIVGDVAPDAAWGPAVTSSLLAALLLVGGAVGAAVASPDALPISVPSSECAPSLWRSASLPASMLSRLSHCAPSSALGTMWQRLCGRRRRQQSF